VKENGYGSQKLSHLSPNILFQNRRSPDEYENVENWLTQLYLEVRGRVCDPT